MRIHDAYTKLDRLDRTTGPGQAGSVSGGAAKGAGAAPAPGAVSTSVSLSARAQELSSLAEPASAKVQALRARIQAGTFQVDARAIAQKLVGDDA